MRVKRWRACIGMDVTDRPMPLGSQDMTREEATARLLAAATRRREAPAAAACGGRLRRRHTVLAQHAAAGGNGCSIRKVASSSGIDAQKSWPSPADINSDDETVVDAETLRSDPELFRRVLRELEFHEERELLESAAQFAAVNSRPPPACDSEDNEAKERDDAIKSGAQEECGHNEQCIGDADHEDAGLQPRSVSRSPATWRSILSPMSNDRIADVFRRLRLRELPSAAEAFKLIAEVAEQLRESASLVHLPRPSRSQKLVIVGDLHGHFNDLLHLLDTFGEPCHGTHYLFNGDFVDRGDWGPEVLLSLFCLKLLHPDAIHMNRGNHEDTLCNEFYGFRAQLAHAYPEHVDDMYDLIHDAFDQLPLCYVIGGDVFVVHGGLPLEDISLDDIAKIPKGPVELRSTDPSERLKVALLWSDPTFGLARPSARGAGAFWSEAETSRFLGRNKLRCIVRAHECVAKGFRYDHDYRVLTLFSASNYDKVNGGNGACVGVIDASMKVIPQKVWNVPYVKASWVKAQPGGRRGDESAAARSRNGAISQWRADEVAEQRACAALRYRSSQTLVALQASPRERALVELRRMIFLARSRLLEAFEAADDKRTGKISLARWTEIMSASLRTPISFPWSQLACHLTEIDSADEVAYIEFLLGFETPLSRMLADKWRNAMLVALAERAGGPEMARFDGIDANGDGVLSFAELRSLFGRHLPTTGKDAAYHDMHAFELFGALDRNRTGFVSRDEFECALRAAVELNDYCGAGHMLVDTRLRSWQCIIDEWLCDECGRSLVRRECRRRCATCDYDLCDACFANRIGLDVQDLVLLRNRRRRLTLADTRVQKELDRFSGALSLLYRSRCDIRAVLGASRRRATDVSELIDRATFVSDLGSLLCGGDDGAAGTLWELMCTCCRGDVGSRPTFAQRQAEELLSVAEIEWCFAIQNSSL
eukprot:TRINITY_DN18484_c0_g1_i1.p1 TRINITY_DN18484_c0_g1~~TRINITY_DN18484_c0_g1_i1.p1  ORF type:complete len:939 (+),score=165.77 TRINITY_DN18484_c0_g1_i1:72-2888(+)